MVNRGKKLRALALFVPLAALTLVGATTPAAGARVPAPHASVPTLNWSATCPQDPVQQVDFTGFECADALVPLDYGDPGGATIHIEVIRHLATDPAHRIGSLFFNPGGPGGSGVLNLPVFYSHFPAALRADFDLVSFDPRGIEHSNPVSCLPTAEDEGALLSKAPVGFPVGSAETTTWINTFKEFGADCGQLSGPLLDHLSTANVARDMDLLRQAVGDAKLNYMAPSYGTYLGATYANLFPTKIRAMDLESNVDAEAWADTAGGSVFGTFLRQGTDIGSAQTLRYFLQQCGLVSADRCAFSAGSPAATIAKLHTLFSRAAAKPIDVGGTPFTLGLITAVVDADLYDTQPTDITVAVPPRHVGGYADLAVLLQQLFELSGPTAVPAHSTVVAQVGRAAHQALLDGGAPSATGGTYGVLCSDSPNPTSPASYAVQAAAARQRSGVMGLLWAWTAEPCASWPVHADPDRYLGPFNRPTSAPILLVGIRNDPATPYQSSVNLSHELANARLLTVAGAGHSVLFNPSTCVDNYASAYFISGTLPAPGTVCSQDKPLF